MELEKVFFHTYEDQFKISDYSDYFKPVFEIHFKHTTPEVRSICGIDDCEAIDFKELRQGWIDFESSEFEPMKQELSWNPLKAIIYLYQQYNKNEYPLCLLKQYTRWVETSIYEVAKPKELTKDLFERLYNDYSNEDFLEKYKSEVIELLTLAMISDEITSEEYEWINKFTKQKIVLDKSTFESIYEKLQQTSYLNHMPKAYHLCNFNLKSAEMNILDLIHGQTNYEDRLVETNYEVKFETEQTEESGLKVIINKIKSLIDDF